jgi:serine/threonine protein kinase
MSSLDARYKLRKKIGEGSFGAIWLSSDLQSDLPIALKIEKSDCPFPQLQHEAKVLKRLQGGPGLPEVLSWGYAQDCVYLAMTLLGPSLEEVASIVGGRLSVKSVLMVGEQVLCRLHYIHSKHYLHRDIKPDNLLFGLGSSQSHVYLVDFGLAKKFRDPQTGTHIAYSDGKGLSGTSRYTSVNTHVGIEQSRRDDIEGLAYVMVYLLKGSLPWQGLTVRTKDERYQRIMETKLALSPSELCKGLPAELTIMLEYARSLAFEQAPDYTYLRRLLKDLITRLGETYDFKYDWTGTTAYRRLETWKTTADDLCTTPTSSCSIA